jgi:hypothetical protein
MNVGLYKPSSGKTVLDKLIYAKPTNLDSGYWIYKLEVVAEPSDASLIDCNLIHGPLAQNMWRSTSKVLEIYLFSMIAAISDFSWPWDWWHWKCCLLIFPCICISPKSEVIRVMYINLKARWSWTLSWTQSQTPGFRIGLDFHHVMHVSLAL